MTATPMSGGHSRWIHRCWLRLGVAASAIHQNESLCQRVFLALNLLFCFHVDASHVTFKVLRFEKLQRLQLSLELVVGRRG